METEFDEPGVVTQVDQKAGILEACRMKCLYCYTKCKNYLCNDCIQIVVHRCEHLREGEYFGFGINRERQLIVTLVTKQGPYEMREVREWLFCPFEEDYYDEYGCKITDKEREKLEEKGFDMNTDLDYELHDNTPMTCRECKEEGTYGKLKEGRYFGTCKKCSDEQDARSELGRIRTEQRIKKMSEKIECPECGQSNFSKWQVEIDYEEEQG